LQTWYDSQVAELRHLGGALALQAPLPVVVEEMGDTWLEGVSSDPSKMAAYRRVVFLRSQCVHHGGCDPASAAMRNATFFLAKLPEHTWGLPSLGDSTSWTNQALEAVLASGNAGFTNSIHAWAEQRQFLWLAQQALAAAAEGTPEQALSQAILPVLRSTIGGDGTPGSTARIPPVVPAPAPAQDSRYIAASTSVPIALQCPGAAASLVMDHVTGAVSQLQLAGSTGSFASEEAPLGLLQYETYDQNQTEAVGKQYNYQNFGLFDKPNVTANANPQAQTLYPTVASAWVASGPGLCSVVARLDFPPHSVSYYGAPAVTWVNITVGSDSMQHQSSMPTGTTTGTVKVTLTMLNATRTRLSQSMHLLFPSIPTPMGQNGTWTLEKLGQPVDPHTVMLNGSQWQHGISSGAVFGPAGSGA